MLRRFRFHPTEILASRSAKALLRLSCLMLGEDKPDESHEYAGTADYVAYRMRETEWLREACDIDGALRT